MEKKYIVKHVLNEGILKKNEYGSYSIGYISDLYHSYNEIKFFESREDAEKYILEKSITKVTIVEIFI